MWSSLLGKAPAPAAEDDAADPPADGDDVPMPDASVEGGASPEEAEPAYDGAALVAGARGRNVLVKVSLNDAEVSAPEESGDEAMAEAEAAEEGPAPEEPTDAALEPEEAAPPPAEEPPAADEPMEESNNSSDADEPPNEDVPPRRGRSASVGHEHDDAADEEESSEPAAPSEEAPATPTPAAAAAEEEGAFEASLLLGIAESSSGVATPQPEKREIPDPSVLPTSMTSFLDMLTEDQRRVRHRHIPGVDGFRRLYKSEVKGDLTEARRTKKAKHVSQQDTDSSAMDVDDEEEEGKIDAADVGDDEDSLPDREAFVAPDKDARAFADRGQPAGLLAGTAFEAALAGGPTPVASGGAPAGAPSLKSPKVVDSLTSFDPPRPQESTASKTKHRLARWEAHPHEVASDLEGYRKTVARTREELHAAQRERERVERVAGVMRHHLAKHLEGYRSEALAANGELQKVHASCLRLEEAHNGRGVSTRGGGKGMKDVLATLKALGEEGKGAKSDGEGPKDWRVPGVGGAGPSKAMANGWILAGDEVKVRSSGEEGTVVFVRGPGPPAEKEEEAPAPEPSTEPEAKKTEEKKAAEAKTEEAKAEEAKADEAKSDEKKDDGEKKEEDKTPEAAPSSKEGDAMDVDSPDKKKEATDAPKEKAEAAAESPKKEEEASPAVLAPSIGVKLAKTGEVKSFAPSALAFGAKKLPPLVHADPSLAQRWEGMVASALANGVEHDSRAMDEHIAASLARKGALDEDDDDEKKDGSVSPKSVADERGLLPFGAGLWMEPAEVRDYPGLMPMDALEKTVRKVTYETARPRVICDMATASSDLKKLEARQEEMNRLKGKVLQLRNRLGRQKRLRSLNERSLRAGKTRAHKVEGLLLEMQVDLRNLKGRLREELNELGIGSAPLENGDNGAAPPENGDKPADSEGKQESGEAGADMDMEPDSKRPRVDESSGVPA